MKQTGSYIFDSNNNIELYGYIYENDFDLLYPSKNLITESNIECDNQFGFGAYLQANVTYILLVTTFKRNTIGSFTVFISGSNNITVNHIGKFILF